MALGRRGAAPGLMHHSERGSQYACGASQELLAAQGMRCRMSRTGDGVENAVVERFFGSFKGERKRCGTMSRVGKRGMMYSMISRCSTTARGCTRFLGMSAPMTSSESPKLLNGVSVFP
jgi:transposase InsO family protein